MILISIQKKAKIQVLFLAIPLLLIQNNKKTIIISY